MEKFRFLSNQRMPVCFVTILMMLFTCLGSVSAQMRQIYIDPEPENEIRKISFYSPTEGYVAFRDYIGYSSDSGRTFSKKYITSLNVDYGVYSVNLTFGFWIEGLKAFSKDTIIVYGHYGLVPAILYSKNGGVSYTLVFHDNSSTPEFKSGITDILFPNGNMVGFAVDADRILKSVNGGITWTRVKLEPNSYFTNLEAVDNNLVFALVQQKIKYYPR